MPEQDPEHPEHPPEQDPVHPEHLLVQDPEQVPSQLIFAAWLGKAMPDNTTAPKIGNALFAAFLKNSLLD